MVITIHLFPSHDQEGEIYVDESEIVDVYIDDDFVTGDARKLH